MLSGDFFYIKDIGHNNGSIKAMLEINPAHKIFVGHFPGQPVVPGVCMIQAVKEILVTVFSKNILLTNADNIKFLNVIDPAVNNIVHAELKYAIGPGEKINVSASFLNNSIISFKMNAVFIFMENQPG